jgi:hypothetical protein
MIEHGVEPKIFWSVENGRGRRGEVLVFLHPLIPGSGAAVKSGTTSPGETTATGKMGMSLLVGFAHPIRTTEGKGETLLMVRVLFSLDGCL